MKTIIFTTAVLFSASLALCKPQMPYLPPDYESVALQDEAFVDDIPFDTFIISQSSVPDKVMMALPEEEYVDDIPFNTEKIAQKALFSKLMNGREEASVDDIPFDTEKIFNKIQWHECLSEWCDEKNVNDIPFNTRYLACCHQMLVDVMPAYVNERAARDICFNTEEIACKYLFNKMVEDYRQEENVCDIPFEPEGTWNYDCKRDILTYQAGATLQMHGIKALNNYDFMLETERYMEEFGERLRELDQLTFENPF
jgi:hypothetical protein